MLRNGTSLSRTLRNSIIHSGSHEISRITTSGLSRRLSSIAALPLATAAKTWNSGHGCDALDHRRIVVGQHESWPWNIYAPLSGSFWLCGIPLGRKSVFPWKPRKGKGMCLLSEVTDSAVHFDPKALYSCAARLMGKLLRRFLIHLTRTSQLPSLKTKSPAEPGAGAVIASGKTGWRPVVPVAIEREIP
jgi:hypothetical protein